MGRRISLPAQETTLAKHERWLALRDHLRAQGTKQVPLKLLQEPEPATRPGMRLVVHYAELKHESWGKLTPRDWVVVSQPIILLVLGAGYGVVNRQLIEQPLTVQLIGGGVLLVLILLNFIWIGWPIFRHIVTRKGPLYMSVEELSLSLPNRNQHVPWCNVHSVAHLPNKFRWMNHSHIRVELNDGVVATLHVPVDDCDPLVEVMRTLILCHREKRE